ncbi:MAG: hypothetical protein IGS39_18485 [Calothrix sp. C42_A2020_038]|nr:hypothetical protein [Calothrix sp. C42_A2020_038]
MARFHIKLHSLHFVTLIFFSLPVGGYFHVNVIENNRPQEVLVSCAYRQKASWFLVAKLRTRYKHRISQQVGIKLLNLG